MVNTDYAYNRLVNTLAPERVARTEFDRMVYSHDFAYLPKIALLQWRLYPDFVVLPQTTEEVSGIVKLSDESHLPIVPRGGGTGWRGGSVPTRGGVLLDMRKMNKVRVFDAAARTVTVEAGATWGDVQAYVEARGLTLPCIPTSAMASTVAGAINSDVSGFGAFRNGTLRECVADLEVVLPDSRVLHTASERDSGGRYADLTPLFFGAEGTLGVITAATLRLDTKSELVKPVAYAFKSTEAAASFILAAVDTGLTPYHISLLDKEHLVFERVLRAGTPEPSDTVLMCLTGPKDDVADQERTLDVLAPKLAGSKRPSAESEYLWDRRFRNYSARRMSRGLIVANNIVPVAKLVEACATARELIQKMKLNGAVQAFLLNTTSAILAPYVLMDEAVSSGVTALGYVKKMGDATFEMGGHPMGLGLFMAFNLRAMHGRAASYTAYVKDVFDAKRKVNPGKTVEVWTKYHFPGIRAIPPAAMRTGLNLAAFLRRIKPNRDKFVRAYEHGKGVA
jgi:glycolate oxidase